jgi:hypothetical protein
MTDRTLTQAPVFFALRCLGLSVAAGTTLMAGVLWGVRTLLLDAPASDVPILAGAPANLLLAGVLIGVVTPGILAWTLLAPLPSWYRRGGLAVAASFGTVLSMLLLTVVHHLLGRQGLMATFVLAGLSCVWLAHPLLVGRGAHE